MKANYLPKNRSGKSRLLQLFILVAILISGATVFYFLDSVIISTASSVWKTENVITRHLRNGVAFFNTRQALVRENAILRERLSVLEKEKTALSLEQIQIDTLLDLVGRKQESRLVAAAVLSHPPQTPYDVLIIDAGSTQSVIEGSKVISLEGSVLGVVSKSFPEKARVKLYSTNGEQTNVVLERDGLSVILNGSGGGNFKLVLPRDVKVEKGDRILSPEIRPRLVAVIEEVNVKPTDSFKEILAKSPVNIFNLRFVFVAP
jgi:cell shape-determining protein MreC